MIAYESGNLLRVAESQARHSIGAAVIQGDPAGRRVAERRAGKNHVGGVAHPFIVRRRGHEIGRRPGKHLPRLLQIEQRGAEGGGIFSERLLLLNGGFDFTHWQANARGVDLNHNYEAGWAEAKMLEREAGIFGGGPTRYGGEFPESEPESAALCAFVRSVDFDAVLALHSQGEEIYYDFGGLAPAGSEQIATVLSKVSGYRAAKPSGIASLSGFKDWFIATYNRPGFTVEMGLGETPLPPQEFDAFYRPLEPLLALLPTLI